MGGCGRTHKRQTVRADKMAGSDRNGGRPVRFRCPADRKSTKKRKLQNCERKDQKTKQRSTTIDFIEKSGITVRRAAKDTEHDDL